MSDSYTEGALRALDRAEIRAAQRARYQVEPDDLLIALADEPESHAALILADHGLDSDRLHAELEISPLGQESHERHALPRSEALKSVLIDANRHARSVDRNRPVGTEHLLAGLLESSGLATDLMLRSGLKPERILEKLTPSLVAETAPIPLDSEIGTLSLADPGEAVDLGRILDASANRAREGLRVVEDYVRFALDDSMLSRRIKEVRHRLAEAVRGLNIDMLINARDTPGDVGTHIMTASESSRENPRAVLSANFRRTAEALRSLEEYAKLIDVWLAGRFEVLRYDVYTLEKRTLTAVSAHRSLGDSRLQVLVGGLPTLGDLTWVVAEALAGGAQVIQLREKGLPDREFLQRAREVRILTHQAQAFFIVNDRADLARLAGADGVHLGQDDLTLRDARRILGTRSLLGVSTHELDQVERATLDGAGYLGVGPVFTSPTKDFSELAGLAYVRLVAESTTLPWFAIGGINESNIDDVLSAGASRIAVSSAVVHAERPRAAAKALRDRLDS